MFTLDKVVPWGRSVDEYRRMFALTEADLGLKIVGCGDGPANFNAEATRRWSTVVSCDPIYRYEVDQLRERIAATSEEKKTRSCLVVSPDELNQHLRTVIVAPMTTSGPGLSLAGGVPV
jgi:hypothetical protein